jgi:hypothetical protein
MTTYVSDELLASLDHGGSTPPTVSVCSLLSSMGVFFFSSSGIHLALSVDHAFCSSMLWRFGPLELCINLHRIFKMHIYCFAMSMEALFLKHIFW